MIKNIGLYGLIVRPDLVIAENINLNWYPGWSGVQLSHEQSEVFMDSRVIL